MSPIFFAPMLLPRGLTPLPVQAVTFEGGFWGQRVETACSSTVPALFRQLESTGAIENFELAAKGRRDGYHGLRFSDSDLYKAIEAAAYALVLKPDPAQEQRIDRVIELIASAQRPDGYLNTWVQVTGPEKQFRDLRDNHELYCAGHLFEAAVAYRDATGKEGLLGVAEKFANLLADTFGEGPGKRPGYCGHPEIELALFKLGRATLNQRYLDLAKHFLLTRGTKFFAHEHGSDPAEYDGRYYQDNVPIREHTAIVGHAVRAAYLMSGVCDLLAEENDAALNQMVERVWRNAVDRNMFVTGGIGSSASNEGFTEDFDLPLDSAYQETCASIALVLWAQRMGNLRAESSYYDVLERALYNGVLAGLSLDGTRFNYVNPLASGGNHHRRDWFDCACCPPNVARAVLQAGHFAYAQDNEGPFVNLFVQSSANVSIGGAPFVMQVKTSFPWSGSVNIRLSGKDSARGPVRVRIPGWCSSYSSQVNGNATDSQVEKGYLVIDREWKVGDEIQLDLEMPVERVLANPMAEQLAGRAALQRGPLIYCFEQVDNAVPLDEIRLPLETEMKSSWTSELGGATVLGGTAEHSGRDWAGALYGFYRGSESTPVRAVPYFLWDNREPGAMQVWIPFESARPVWRWLEGQAAVVLSHTSESCVPEAVNNGRVPKSSSVRTSELCHFWPRKGGVEWVQYSWPTEVSSNRAEVFFFDDTGAGECRLPAEWWVEALVGDKWVQVGKGGTPVSDGWNVLKLEPVSAKSMRLHLIMQEGWSGGVHEWRLWPTEPGRTQ